MSEAGLPLYDLRTRPLGEGMEVFCPLRKRWLVLSPEEHVRQCLIQWLSEEKEVPRGLMSVERGLRYDRLQKRYDLLVYDREGKPLLLSECKAPYVPLSEDTVQQLALYNSQLHAPWLLICNGPQLMAFGWQEMEQKYLLCEDLPVFLEM